MSKQVFKSGYIGLIGRTNVGKSTLVNKIFDKNIVITSDRAQTTRDRINCIYNNDNVQAIFVDCPGFFKPRNLLGDKLNKIIYEVLEDIDIITVIVDLASGIGKGDAFVFKQIENSKKPRFLLLNKIDILDKDDKDSIKRVISEMKKEFYYFEEIIPISALTGENVDLFLERVIEKLPEGPAYYPEEMVTDMPAGKIISEVIRQKLAENLYEELPHSINVELVELKNTKTKNGEPLTRIECIIYVEKKSHKSIIIGRSGEMLKRVGAIARKELEEILETKVYLQLWVKIIENWTKNETYLNRLGF